MMPVTSKGTNGGRRPFTIALLFTVLTTALIAGPAAAATAPISDYGNTVKCRYKADGPGPFYDFRLKKLVVTAPVMHGRKSTPQVVGWRFIVTRSFNWGAGPWKETYRSPIQKRSATATTAAAFTARSVGVVIPDVDNVTSVHYQVTFKLLRYRNDGSVKSQVTYLMPYMKWIQNGEYGDYADLCVAGFYEGS